MQVIFAERYLNINGGVIELRGLLFNFSLFEYHGYLFNFFQLRPMALSKRFLKLLLDDNQRMLPPQVRYMMAFCDLLCVAHSYTLSNI